MRKIETLLIIICLFCFTSWMTGNHIFEKLTLIFVIILIVYYLLFPWAILLDLKIKQIFKLELYKNLKALKLVQSFLFGLSVPVVLFGGFYNFMSWPYPIIIFLLCLIPILIFLWISVHRFIQSKSKFYKTMIIRCVLFIILSFTLFLLPHP